MLSLDTLYAVMQGLPVDRLQHLKDTPWRVLCWRIERELAAGHRPLLALQTALKDLGDWERQHIRQALAHVLPVMHISGLSYRQRQALITLRYLGSASLTQLSYTLMADRGNTHRRLQALVHRGLALKFSQPGGVCYMAITNPLSKEIKLGVQSILDALVQEAASEAPTKPTTSTTPAQPT